MQAYKRINYDNIVHNYFEIKNYQQKEIFAVLKQDAYGHGLKETAQALYDNNVRFFAVINEEEANIIAPIVKDSIILIMSYVNNNDYIVTVHDFTSLELAIKNNNIFHIKFDTGMGRLGLDISDINEIKKYDLSNCQGVFTHFATSDLKDDLYDKQKKEFNEIVNQFDVKYYHAANSSSGISEVLDFTNACRVGISLYGYKECQSDLNLLPAFEVIAPIIQVKNNYNGPIGYHSLYIAKDDNIAVLPIGYGDGLMKSLVGLNVKSKLGNKGIIVGSICMNFIFIKCDNIIDAEDEFVIIDSDNIAIAAKLNNSNVYEIITNIKRC